MHAANKCKNVVAVIVVAAVVQSMVLDIKQSFQEKIISTTIPGRYDKLDVLMYFTYVPERLHAQFPDRKQVHVDVNVHNKDPRTCLTKQEIMDDLDVAQWKLAFSSPASVQPGFDGGRPSHHLPQMTFLKGDQGVLSVS
jgi:hypothetical protein